MLLILNRRRSQTIKIVLEINGSFIVMSNITANFNQGKTLQGSFVTTNNIRGSI